MSEEIGRQSLESIDIAPDFGTIADDYDNPDIAFRQANKMRDDLRRHIVERDETIVTQQRDLDAARARIKDLENTLVIVKQALDQDQWADAEDFIDAALSAKGGSDGE